MNEPLRIHMAWGYVDIGPTNEVHIVSTVEDPPKVRLAAAAGRSLGAISFNRLRADGQQEEVVLLQGKIDERWPVDSLVGELRLDLRRPARPGESDDAQMVPIVLCRHDGVTWLVPQQAADSGAVTADAIVSATGRYRLLMQNDGNLVIYDDVRGLPIWASNSVQP